MKTTKKNIQKKGSNLNLWGINNTFLHGDIENTRFINAYSQSNICYSWIMSLTLYMGVKKDKKTKNNAGKFKVLSPNFQNTKRGIKICMN